MITQPQTEPAVRGQRRIQITAFVAGLLGLGLAVVAFWFMQFMVYGFGGSDPDLNVSLYVFIPLISVLISIGPAVMMMGRTKRRWRKITAAVFVAGLIVCSLVTWVNVLFLPH